MEKQSLVFLGSKPIGYHCLYFLIQQQERLNIRITGLLTNDNPRFSTTLSLAKLANDHGIPIIDSLDALPQTDILYSVQYHEILSQKEIAKANKLAVNLHMAPLPEYRGCNQFSFAILDNKQEFGTTIHKIDKGIDHGDILFERRFPIPEKCWVHELYDLTLTASIDLFIETIENIIEGNYEAIPQDDLIPARGCSIHYRHEIESIKKIDLSWDEEKINRHIRATYMPGFEPPYTFIDDKKIYFNTSWK